MRLVKLFILLMLVFSYLLFSYVRFYHFIGDTDLKSPYLQNSLVIQNQNAKGVVKYVALGDSLSAGVGSSTIEETFVYQFALNLSKKYAKIQLVNLAWPGDTSAEVIKNQLPRALSEKPDYVTLLIGTNDVHNKITTSDFNQKYTFILNELLAKTSAKITVLNIPYLGSSKIVYPPFNFLLDFRIKQFNKIILNIVANIPIKERVRFIDLYKSTYAVSSHNTNYYSSDLFHPSETGYKIWGEIINAN